MWHRVALSVLQPTTRGPSRGFGFRFSSFIMKLLSERILCVHVVNKAALGGQAAQQIS